MSNNSFTNDNSLQRASTATARRLRRAVLVGAILSTSLGAAVDVDAADPGTVTSTDSIADRSLATFDGRTIDLSKSWDGARACWVDEVGSARCFATEADMDRALKAAGHDLGRAEPTTTGIRPQGALAANCSSSLRLYRDTSYGGSVLYLSQRGYWINLSSFGFDNVVSSHQVGGCSATYRSASNGTGTTYGGATYAWAAESSMPGWDNVLSSVKIN